MPLAEALTRIGRSDLIKSASAELDFSDRESTVRSFVQAIIKNASAEVLTTCENHARFWGVLDQCKTAQATLTAAAPELPDRAFALVQDFNGQRVRKYAAVDTASTAEAVYEFYADRAKYPLAWRKQAAAQLLFRAERDHVQLTPEVEIYLQKAAGCGYPSAQSAEDAYVSRADRIADPEILAKFSELIEHFIVSDAACQNDDLVKEAVETLAELDTQLGLTDYYATREVSLPEELLDSRFVAAAMPKHASAMCQLTNGRQVDLSQLSPDVLEVIDPALTKLGQDELAQVLPTLPKGDAELLSRLVKTSAMAVPGVGPTPAEENANEFLSDLKSPNPVPGPVGGQPLNFLEQLQGANTAPSAMPPVAPAAPAPVAAAPAQDAAFPPAPAAPAAPMDVDSNVFTDATADAMAAPRPDVMTEGAPLAAATPGIDTSYPGAGAGLGGFANATNTAARNAGQAAPIHAGFGR